MAHNYLNEHSSYRVLESEGVIIEEAPRIAQEFAQQAVPLHGNVAEQSFTQRAVSHLPSLGLATIGVAGVAGLGLLGKYIYDKIKEEQNEKPKEEKKDDGINYWVERKMTGDFFKDVESELNEMLEKTNKKLESKGVDNSYYEKMKIEITEMLKKLDSIKEMPNLSIEKIQKMLLEGHPLYDSFRNADDQVKLGFEPMEYYVKGGFYDEKRLKEEPNVSMNEIIQNAIKAEEIKKTLKVEDVLNLVKQNKNNIDIDKNG